MKILVVFGTRPEAIKLAPVIKILNAQTVFETSVCVTAQHRMMLDKVLSIYGIIPQYDLNIMSMNQSLSHITHHVLCGLETVLNQFKPQWLLVHGDTSTAFAGALAAFYHKINIGHVEAGLRTYHLHSPWPEEANRQLIARLARLHFAPTAAAQNNLLSEGITKDSIVVTGNTIVDALQEIVAHFKNNTQLTHQLSQQFNFLSPHKKLILVTLHRRENIGKGLKNICGALLKIAQRPDVQIVYPVHPNPNVREPVMQWLGNHRDIYLLDPQDYLPFVYLMMRAYLIVTDSGGVQEEAPSFGKPVLVLREKTERPEGVEAGIAKLVGISEKEIVRMIDLLCDNKTVYKAMQGTQNPYGDGQAATRIVESLCRLSIKLQ